ncbi:MAG: GspMb/PilO family protein, partial [Deltaproteobacteria bacterium]
MKHRKISSARLAFGLCVSVIILLGVFGVVIPAARWKAEMIARRDAARIEETKLTANVAKLTSELAALSDDHTDLLAWSAGQIGEATARVQSEISAIATRNGVAVRSVTPNIKSTADIGTAVSFRVEGEATLDALVAFEVELDFHQPVFLVEQAVLRRL